MASNPDTPPPSGGDRDDSTVSASGDTRDHIDLLPGGGRIGTYRLIGPIGRGGMGQVWRAEAAESCPVPAGREIALKLLHRVSIDERRRAAREVAHLQALHHPGSSASSTSASIRAGRGSSWPWSRDAGWTR